MRPESILERSLLVLASFLVAAPLVADQGGDRLLFEPGVPGETLGRDLALLGDVDGDGVGDFLVAAEDDVLLLSGADGDRLWTIPGDGNSVPRLAVIGDSDGDGVSDLAVGRWLDSTPSLRSTGSVSVYSGATGTLLFEVYGTADDESFGYDVDGIDDLDGDGIDDLMVGARRTTGTVSEATILSGLDGTVIDRLASPTTFISEVGDAGDIDGDGRRDLLVGGDGGDAVFVYSGATRTLLLAVTDTVNAIGTAPTTVGDVDADGTPDLAVAGRTPDGYEVVFVYSGADGTTLHRLEGWRRLIDHNRIAAAGDFDGDGHADILVGSPLASTSGAVTVYSGADGTPLFRTFDGRGGPAQLGASVTGIGDHDGDGFDDILVGAPFAGKRGSGRGDSGFITVFAGGPSASTPTLTLTGDCATSLTATVVDAEPGTRIALVHGSTTGTTVLRDGNCLGLTLPLDTPAILGIQRIGATGTRVMTTAKLPAGLCGQTMLALDLDHCRVSAAVAIP